MSLTKNKRERLLLTGALLAPIALLELGSLLRGFGGPSPAGASPIAAVGPATAKAVFRPSSTDKALAVSAQRAMAPSPLQDPFLRNTPAVEQAAPTPPPAPTPVRAPTLPVPTLSSVMRGARGEGICMIDGELLRVGGRTRDGWRIEAIDLPARAVILVDPQGTTKTITISGS